MNMAPIPTKKKRSNDQPEESGFVGFVNEESE